MSGLLLVGATFIGGLLGNLLMPGLFRKRDIGDIQPIRQPTVTPGQAEAARLGLAEARFTFERETQQAALSLASRVRAGELVRFNEERRRVEAARSAVLLREELRQQRAVVARRKELELQIEANREAQEFEAETRAVEVQLATVVRLQDSKRREFEAFARSLAPGFIPVVSPVGQFTAIAPGSTLTPGDVRRGLEPLPFQPSLPTAARITQVPGVFIGPTFRFKSIESAQDFFISSRLKAAGKLAF